MKKIYRGLIRLLVWLPVLYRIYKRRELNRRRANGTVASTQVRNHVMFSKTEYRNSLKYEYRNFIKQDENNFMQEYFRKFRAI